jgi:hypothetical protein
MTSCTITLLVPADLSTLRESPGSMTMGDMTDKGMERSRR